MPAGAPAQAISGEMPAPSQLNFDRIAAPSAKAGLLILKGASGGTADREAGAGLVAADVATGVASAALEAAVAGRPDLAPSGEQPNATTVNATASAVNERWKLDCTGPSSTKTPAWDVGSWCLQGVLACSSTLWRAGVQPVTNDAHVCRASSSDRSWRRSRVVPDRRDRPGRRGARTVQAAVLRPRARELHPQGRGAPGAAAGASIRPRWSWPRTFGTKLFGALFEGDVRELYRSVIRRSASRRAGSAGDARR